MLFVLVFRLGSMNVLYDRELRIKLCDFGFAKFKDKLDDAVQFESRVGTPVRTRAHARSPRGRLPP